MSARIVLAGLLGGALLAGCEGRVTLSVTDAAVDKADAVVVEFTAVDLERGSGDTKTVTFDSPVKVDLLALEGGDRHVLLDGLRVDADDYRAIKLHVRATGSGTDSYVDPRGGTRTGLLLDPADAGGLVVTQAFTVGRDSELALTIDVDLRRSIREPATPTDPYGFVPTLRMVEDQGTGSLAGDVVANASSVSGCDAAVYVYAGTGVTSPDDVGGSGPQPVNTGRVLADKSFRVGLLPAGPYTAALTCQADNDEPDSDDSVTFITQKNVTVTAGKPTSLDF